MNNSIKLSKNSIKDIFLQPALWIWLAPLLIAAPNIALAVTETYPWLMKVANILLPLGLWTLVMGLVRRTGTALLWLICIYVFCAFQIVLLYLYGESIIAIDMFMNLVTTNVGEATELLGNLKIALLVVIVLYLPPIVAGIWMTVRKVYAPESMMHCARLAGLSLMAAGIVALWTSVLTDGKACRPSRQLFPYNVISNLVTAIQRTAEARHYAETSATFTYNASSTRPDSIREVYVFVIGETSRADNWSLFGYDRDTNPRLGKREGVIGFGHALSEINTTHKSVPMLLSDLDSETFGRDVARTRSIFEAFRKAGYSTHFISNQHRNHSYIDFYAGEADNIKFITDGGAPQDDQILAGELERILREDKARKIFVVLHTYGSHFEYQKRYPKSAAYFKPDGNTEASRLNRDQLLNAYDNTIRYTDLMLDRIITALDSTGVCAGMLYVSDHGEDIFDDSRERFLHASPVATYYQLHVPMVLWMSGEMRDIWPEMYERAKANSDRQVSSSRSVFHTLMDMAGLRSPALSVRHSLVSDHYSDARHFYLNDYNESLPLSESGLRDEDFKRLEAAGITVD